MSVTEREKRCGVSAVTAANRTESGQINKDKGRTDEEGRTDEDRKKKLWTKPKKRTASVF
jgi:hypothetical protein